MWDPPPPVVVSEDQRRTLKAWLAARKTPKTVAVRAQIVLMAGAGMPNRRIAEALGVRRPTVILWRERFQAGGTTALTEEKPGRGRKPRIGAEKVREIVEVVEATLHTTPRAATHWTVRTMAKEMG